MKTLFLSMLKIMTVLLLTSASVMRADVTVKGTVRYWDDATSSYKPVSETEIRYYNAGGAMGYTDANGYFEKTFTSSSPIDNATAYVFFRNTKIDLRGAITTRSDSRSALSFDNPPPTVYVLDFDFTGDWANYAKIFDHANKAANFSVQQGFTPAQCIVKYPLQSSIVNQVWISAEGSFFWPSSTVSFPPPDQSFINTILSGIISVAGYFGYTGELTANTIYINDLAKYNPSTVYHEYGHFIMKQKRGDWPVTQTEYATGQVPFNHVPTATTQNSRQAYIEGWANFYELAVIGWAVNPSSPYTGTSKIYEDYVMNGYNHEYTVANTFFDFYDPADDEGFQTSYANISNVMGEKQNLMLEFNSTLAHKSYVTDQQRNTGIALMNLNKMSPISSYGNAAMYIKNDFNGGVVNINGGDVNTSSLGGVFSTTELWMSTYRTLLAKEQMYDNYQRLFKHTRPVNAIDTWTTGNPQKNNFTETWGVYTDALTFTSNFDKGCNITYTQQGDGGVLSNTTTSYRSDSPVSLSAPDITQSGVTYKFLNWEDGSTANPRVITASQHQTITANYKGLNVSNTATAISGNNQRKMVRTSDGRLHKVYESAGKVFYQSTAPNSTTWQTVQFVSGGNAKNPSITYCINDILIVFQEASGTTDADGVTLAYLRAGTTVFSYYLLTPELEYVPNNISLSPVIAIDNVRQFVVLWKSTYGSNGVSEGLHARYGMIDNENNITLNSWNVLYPDTDVNSFNPTISATKLYNPSGLFHVAWEQRSGANASIYFRKMTVFNNAVTQMNAFTDISIGSGYSKNTNPSIVALSELSSSASRICWLGGREEEEQEQLSKSNIVEGAWTFRTLFKDTEGSTFWTFGTSPTASPTINTGTDRYVLAWSEGEVNKFTDSRTLSTIQTLSSIGADIHMANADVANNMYALAFKSSSLPYSFSLSQNIGSLPKSNEAQSVANGREGIVYTGAGQVFFAIGDVTLDGNNISFINCVDTAIYKTAGDINSYLLTEPFKLTNTSVFNYGVSYGVADSLSAHNMLRQNKSVTFKVELFDDATGEIIGTYNQVKFDSTKSFQYNNLAYNVETNGIGTRVVRLRLVVQPQGEFSYSLSSRFASGSALGLSKSQSKPSRLNYQGGLKITSYDLLQNYPNPFNPTTTIRYDLSKEGFVTLKVYDMLGKEVETLVNSFKQSGRYTAMFDASQLASGMYIYKLTSDKYTEVKKMIFLK